MANNEIPYNRMRGYYMINGQGFPTTQKWISIIIIGIFLIGSFPHNVYGIEWDKRIKAEEEALRARENSFIITYGYEREDEIYLKNFPGEEGKSKFKLVSAEDVYKLSTSMINMESIIVEENKILHQFESYPDDPYYPFQWGLYWVRSKDAWNIIFDNDSKKPVTVAVIDSGIDLNHEDLKNRISDRGYNFLLGNNDIYDLLGHGTKISGIIAATTNNGIGISGVGGNSDIRILPLQVSNYKGESYLSDVLDAVEYAIELKVDVINLSLGSNKYSQIENDTLQKAISKGIVVVAAAGNSEDSSYIYPASYDNVISVGSISSNGEISYFSNLNDKVDIFAPGEGILSTDIDDSYSYNNGTSFAAPIVSGVISVLIANKPSLTVTEISSIIQNTADSMPTQENYKTLNYYNAIKYILPINIPVNSLGLNISNLELEIGQSHTIIPFIEPDNATNKTISWTTDNSEVAVVDNFGNVVAVGSGETNITAITEDGGKVAICPVKVKNPKEDLEIRFNYESMVLQVGQTKALEYEIFPQKYGYETLSWNSNNPDVVTVDSKGRINAKQKGTAIIIVSTGDGKGITVIPIKVVQANLEWNIFVDVPINKVWNIKFNAEPNPDSIRNSIYVFDDNGGDIGIKTEYEENIVKVTPLEPYFPGNRYYLFIDNTIQSHYGSGLKQSVIMEFVII